MFSVSRAHETGDMAGAAREEPAAPTASIRSSSAENLGLLALVAPSEKYHFYDALKNGPFCRLTRRSCYLVSSSAHCPTSSTFYAWLGRSLCV